MKIIESLITLFIFFWILVFAFGFPSPINWLVLGNVTLCILIKIELETREK